MGRQHFHDPVATSLSFVGCLLQPTSRGSGRSPHGTSLPVPAFMVSGLGLIEFKAFGARVNVSDCFNFLGLRGLVGGEGGGGGGKRWVWGFWLSIDFRMLRASFPFSNQGFGLSTPSTLTDRSSTLRTTQRAHIQPYASLTRSAMSPKHP